MSNRRQLLRLKEVIKDGIEAALMPAGFVPTGKPLTWGRSAGELTHLVGIHRMITSHSVQWSVGCRPAAWLLWGDGDPRDVGYCVVAGSLNKIVRSSHGNGWTMNDTSTPEDAATIAAWLKSDLEIVAKHLDAFRTRRGLWTYLLQNRDAIDRRDFSEPVLLPFKLAAAAALALAGGDLEGCELVEEAEFALRGFRDKLHRDQVSRLRAAAREICL
jgi:hypothetical protein